MIKLKIDPEFRDKIPALTDAEFEQLKENILADGEVYEPIITWQNTIVDGHNRWRIICENWEKLKDKFRTKPMDFADKWEAFEWMYKKQLGRRNLTEEQKAYMVGKMYEARKKSVGAQEGNSNAEKQSGQNVHIVSRREQRNGTAGEIGKEIGVDGRTVRRAEKFAKGVDALREQNNEAAEKILSGTSGMSKGAVAEIPNKTTQEIADLAREILTGEVKKTAQTPRKMPTKQDREDRAMIAAICADMQDPTTRPEFTIDFLLEDIQLNGQTYVELLRNTLTDRSTLLVGDNRKMVADAIQTYVIDEIMKLKELLK